MVTNSLILAHFFSLVRELWEIEFAANYISPP